MSKKIEKQTKEEAVLGFITAIMPKHEVYEIQIRSVGKSVRLLQEVLNSKGYNFIVDGIFTKKMENVIKEIQKENNIFQSGKVDTKTWEALLK